MYSLLQINEGGFYLCTIAKDIKRGHSFPPKRDARVVLWPEVHIYSIIFIHLACIHHLRIITSIMH